MDSLELTKERIHYLRKFKLMAARVGRFKDVMAADRQLAQAIDILHFYEQQERNHA